jgi:hypothetical protein
MIPNGPWRYGLGRRSRLPGGHIDVADIVLGYASANHVICTFRATTS